MPRATLPLAARFHVALARTLDWAWAGGAAWAYGDAVREAPEVPDLRFRQGQALGRAARWPDAVAALTAAARLEPTNAEYQGALVVALHRSGRDHDLVQALERLAELRPGQGELRLLIGAVLRRCGRMAEALHAFRLGVRLASSPPTRRFLLGEILLGCDGWEDAVAAWREARAIELGPEASGGRSALNFHPGGPLLPASRARRDAGPSAGWVARLRDVLTPLESMLRKASARPSGAASERRVRGLRRAWQKVQSRRSAPPSAA